MDQTLYDEFGNYIGPDLVDDEDEDASEASGSEEEQNGLIQEVSAPSISELHDVTASRAIVPHEEKKYYPDAEEVYPGVETLVEVEDTQPLTEPIIAPVRTKDFDIIEKEVPVTSFSYEFMAGMMSHPDLIRQICFLGNLHCGKTSLMDILVQQTHNNSTNTKWDIHKQPLYTNNRKDEISRGLSVKAVPMSLVLPSSNEKSYLFHVLDTPGHSNFQDECTAAMRLCDGAVIVADAVMGLTFNTEKLLHQALQEALTVTLIINGMDRLILELRIPPADAFFKLRHTIEEINVSAERHTKSLGLPRVRFSPSLGNVAFASGLYGFIFTLQSFASAYADTYRASTSSQLSGGWMRGTEGEINVLTFAKVMWGDFYHNRKTGEFSKSPTHPEHQRSFVEFILNPMYKIFAHTVGEEQPTLDPILQELGVFLKKPDFQLDSIALLRTVCRQFFGDASAFVDMIVNKVPSPKANAATKVRTTYAGDISSDVALDMINMKPESETLIIHTTKSYHRPDCSAFDVLGRVMSGTVYKGQKVKVLGESYDISDTEDMELREITHLWIYQAGRYRVEVSHVPAGNWVLLGGLSEVIAKTSTITNATVITPQGPRPSKAEVETFKPMQFTTQSVIRVSCEPLNPSELPKMLEGFRKVSRAYPLCQTKVEESGELVVLGTGELYLDCILHDLRKLYGDLEIKVADPVVQFCETVVESSALKCFSETPNKKNRFHMIAEPLEKGLAEDIEKGRLVWPGNMKHNLDDVVDVWDEKRMSDYLTTQYDWDILAARSVWAFGPDDRGPNILLDDTLPTDVDKRLLGTVKDLVVQGFQWVTREGPLIEEAVRNVKFRLLDAMVSSEPAHRGGGQIIPTARRVAYSAFLLATPRLMEPMYFVEIECPADCVSAVYSVLARRRGHIAKDAPKPGTPVYIVHAYLPAIESFGFETDLRTHTSGQAFCSSIFDHWALVPGDPLDKSIVLRPLEPAPAPHLAREFLLKTRRRKGLSENVAVSKFFDDPMLVELARHEAELDQYL